MPNRRRLALRAQAAYYIVSGMWPLVSRRSFETVTGRKRDWWLVQMVGLLAMTSGIAIGIGTLGDQPSPETLALSILCAFSFATIDSVYALKRTIPRVYLADAALELAMVAVVVAGAER